MSKKRFSEEEQEKLKKNPWIKKVTDKSILYSDEFREHFIKEYNLGKGPNQIFIESGFDPAILGYDRIRHSSERFRKMDKRIDGLKDMRSEKSGRRSEKELSEEEKIEKLKEENKKLKQQLEFLKKMEYLARKAKSGVSRRKKDMKQ